MNHTQVELTSPKGDKEIWWLPVPEHKAHVGETITRKLYDQACSISEDPFYFEDWKISQVCVTLREEDIPAGSRVATGFKREAHTLASMSI